MKKYTVKSLHDQEEYEIRLWDFWKIGDKVTISYKNGQHPAFYKDAILEQKAFDDVYSFFQEHVVDYDTAANLIKRVKESVKEAQDEIDREKDEEQKERLQYSLEEDEEILEELQSLPSNTLVCTGNEKGAWDEINTDECIDEGDTYYLDYSNYIVYETFEIINN